jgi:hypothetical protein
MGAIGLSPSSLGLFVNCPRCLWLDKNRKIRQPDGIKASLPKGMDAAMKAFVDGCVARGEPVSWLADLPGATPLKDRAKLKKFMSWTTFQTPEMTVDGATFKLWGNVDDVIEHPDGSVTPWDFKTKANEPDDAYGRKYYQTQLDVYHVLLEAQGLKCTGQGILTYGWPISIVFDQSMTWGWKNLTMDTNPTRALTLAAAAAKCIAGPKPLPGLSVYDQSLCGFCKFATEREMEESGSLPVPAPKKAKAAKK